MIRRSSDKSEYVSDSLLFDDIEECRSKIFNYDGGSKGLEKIELSLAGKLKKLTEQNSKIMYPSTDELLTLREQCLELVDLQKKLRSIYLDSTYHRLATACFDLGKKYQDKQEFKKAISYFNEALEHILAAIKKSPQYTHHINYKKQIISYYLGFLSHEYTHVDTDAATKLSFNLHLESGDQPKAISCLRQICNTKQTGINTEFNKLIEESPDQRSKVLLARIRSYITYFAKFSHFTDKHHHRNASPFLSRHAELLYICKRLIKARVIEKLEPSVEKQFLDFYYQQNIYDQLCYDEIISAQLAKAYYCANQNFLAYHELCEFKKFFETNHQFLPLYLVIAESYAHSIMHNSSTEQQAEKMFLDLIKLNKNIDKQVLAFCYANLGSIYLKQYAEKRSIRSDLKEQNMYKAFEYFEQAYNVGTNEQRTYRHMMIAALLSLGLYMEGVYKEAFNGQHCPSNDSASLVYLEKIKGYYQLAIVKAEFTHEKRKLGDAQLHLAAFFDFHAKNLSVELKEPKKYYLAGIENLLIGMFRDRSLLQNAHDLFKEEYIELKKQLNRRELRGEFEKYDIKILQDFVRKIKNTGEQRKELHVNKRKRAESSEESDSYYGHSSSSTYFKRSSNQPLEVSQFSESKRQKLFEASTSKWSKPYENKRRKPLMSYEDTRREERQISYENKRRKPSMSYEGTRREQTRSNNKRR